METITGTYEIRLRLIEMEDGCVHPFLTVIDDDGPTESLMDGTGYSSCSLLFQELGSCLDAMLFKWLMKDRTMTRGATG